MDHLRAVRDHVGRMPALPPFQAHVAPVTAAELGASWRRGCPVGPAQLRAITLSYVGFDGKAHTGQIVVNRARDRRGRDGVSPALRRALPDPAHASRSRGTAAATTGRWRPTTPPGSTAATPSRRGRSSGRCTPTARRSTSTPSRTRTSKAARCCRPAGKAYVNRSRVPAGDGGRRRRARARVRVSRLALGRSLDRVPRLAALFEDGRLTARRRATARGRPWPDERQPDREEPADDDRRHRAEECRGSARLECAELVRGADEHALDRGDAAEHLVRRRERHGRLADVHRVHVDESAHRERKRRQPEPA